MPNPSSHAARSYQRTQVESRTPIELVVLLYDGALRFLDNARNAIERHDITARREAVSRALAIVSELQSTLDLERGGDVAKSLDGLYAHITFQLMEASRRRDVGPIDHCTRLVTTLRDAWADIARGASSEPQRMAR
jgi:flagellar protein FliS